MTNITIDRAENVIVNKGGKAHHTGWVVTEAFRVGGSPALRKGTGGYNAASGSYTTDTTGQAIPVSPPLSVTEFQRLTGWAPEA